ncbi:cytochrome P450 [Desertimonas flava]|uniref:cytochrome P450 n=1 Tax=Desertimonas flava TaxID=2064846 RepID=UPI001969020A|nr:cytochrome P450 [Desertimonas flava]
MSNDLFADGQFVVTFDRAGTRTPSHPTRPEIELLSPDFYGARFDELTVWMRAEAPMYWDDSVGIWGAAAYEDVKRLSREWRTFCSGQGSRPESSVPSMINMDPPEHTRRRRMVSAGFTLRRVQDHEPYLRDRVTRLIDSVIERGECDVVADIATPLPMYMIGELMGLPEADHAQLLHWSDLFATGGSEIGEQVVEAVRAYSDYILAKVAERRGGTAEDLVSLVVNADDEQGPLSDVDLVFETMLVLVGGDETTRHVISGGVAALLRHPDQLERLRDEPQLLPGAIEEMLRWVTPIRNMNRTATVDVEVNGQQVRAGDRILLLYPSANRDESVFEDPYRFDITRSPNDHVSFGAFGRHHCLGAPLARLELRVLFEELIARLDDLELATANDLPRRRGNFVLGLEALPVRFRPGARRATAI